MRKNVRNSRFSFYCGKFSYQSFYVDSDENLYSWGFNNSGQLSLNHRKNVFSPKLVDLRRITNNNPKIIKENNQIIVAKISTGHTHTLLLTNKHQVLGCGSNSTNCLCQFSEIPFVKEFVLLEQLISNRVVDIFCGFRNSFYVCENEGSKNQTVLCSGNNSFGQLGVDSVGDIREKENKHLPRKVVIHGYVKEISGSIKITYFLMDDGTIQYCGWNYWKKQSNYKSDEFIKIPELLTHTYKGVFFTKIASGKNHFLAISKRKELYCIEYERLNACAKTKVMCLIDIFKDVNDIKCGYFHSVILAKSVAYGIGQRKSIVAPIYGKKMWGRPLKFSFNELQKNVLEINAGSYSTFLFLQNGSLIVSGSNQQGSLGLRKYYRSEKFVKNNLIKNVRENERFENVLSILPSNSKFFDLIINCY